MSERRAYGDATVAGKIQIDVAGQCRAQLRQQSLHPIDDLDDIAARLLEKDQHHRRFVVDIAHIAHILDRVADLSDVAKQHGTTVAIGDDEIGVVGRVLRLVVGVELKAALAFVDRAFGAIGVRGRKRGANLLHGDPVIEQSAGIEIDAHGRKRAAADIDIADSVDLKKTLLKNRRRAVVELARRERLGGEREDQDRRLGGIESTIGRLCLERGRGIRACGVDRRLHVARRAVDVAIEAKLQNDAGRADRVLGGHLGDVRDLAETPLERRGHRGRHCLRTRAGHLRLHHYRREIDLGQRRDGQRPDRQEAGDGDGERQQRRGDRSPDEERGHAHEKRSGDRLSSGRAPTRRRNRTASRSKAR